MKQLIAPSILTADLGNINQILDLINESEADWIHLDIMDGVFVPNLTFGFQVISTIRQKSTKPLDVHLMMVQPERYIEHFRDSGADILTIHYEACTHLHRTIQQIKENGMKAGVAINPHTPVDLLRDVLDDLDLALIMSVNPGFGGQKFIPNSMVKIRDLKRLITDRQSDVLIEVDGGVSLSNCSILVEAGANVLVAGNAIFSSDDPISVIRQLKKI